MRPYFNVLLVRAIDHASSTTHEKGLVPLVPTPWFQADHPEACDIPSTAIQHARTVPGTHYICTTACIVEHCSKPRD